MENGPISCIYATFWLFKSVILGIESANFSYVKGFIMWRESIYCIFYVMFLQRLIPPDVIMKSKSVLEV